MTFLSSLFSTVESIDPEPARELMGPSGGATFLDVRQPKEYERGHIPGAVLIPLKELGGRLQELDRSRPIVVYCASGVRSSAAARILKGAGFEKVYNLKGGMKAWEGHRASGPVEFGMEPFLGKGEFQDIFQAAYSMEHNLGLFYSSLAEATSGQEEELLRRLAGFEEVHKALLKREWGGGREPEDTLEAAVEGGWDLDELLGRINPQRLGVDEIISMAMAIEAQAMDLYSRLARLEEAHRPFFQFMTREEEGHLALLERELDLRLGDGRG